MNLLKETKVWRGSRRKQWTMIRLLCSVYYYIRTSKDKAKNHIDGLTLHNRRDSRDVDSLKGKELFTIIFPLVRKYKVVHFETTLLEAIMFSYIENMLTSTTLRHNLSYEDKYFWRLFLNNQPKNTEIFERIIVSMKSAIKEYNYEAKDKESYNNNALTLKKLFESIRWVFTLYQQ